MTKKESAMPSPVKYYLAERAHYEILQRVEGEIQELRRHGKHEIAAVVKDMGGMIRDVLEKHLGSDGEHTPPDATEKPLGNRERTTLLLIIAALAKEAKIDISHPSKAGELVANLIDLLGAQVAPRTIEDHLRRIPEAIQRREK